VIIKYFLFFVFCSCTDFLLYEESYNSIYIKGEAWVEIGDDTNNIFNNIFSLELWFSAINNGTTQTILSIIDENEKINFGLFINAVNPKIIQVRHENLLVDLIELDNSIYNDSFYSIAIISHDETDIYINGYKRTTIDFPINIENNIIVLGAKTNKSHSILENYFHGYIDEARLWNINLDAESIEFHHHNSNKLSVDSDDSILQNLSGLWRFNNSDGNYSYIIQDQTCQAIISSFDDYICTVDNDAILYTINSGSAEYSSKHK